MDGGEFEVGEASRSEDGTSTFLIRLYDNEDLDTGCDGQN